MKIEEFLCKADGKFAGVSEVVESIHNLEFKNIRVGYKDEENRFDHEDYPIYIQLERTFGEDTSDQYIKDEMFKDIRRLFRRTELGYKDVRMTTVTGTGWDNKYVMRIKAGLDGKPPCDIDNILENCPYIEQLDCEGVRITFNDC